MFRKKNRTDSYHTFLTELDNISSKNRLKETDNLIEVMNYINDTYVTNNINNEHFTGWNHTDVVIRKIYHNSNPNNYEPINELDEIISGAIPIKYNEPKKENIVISEEVNCIQDLIQITELYAESLDGQRQYNINMPMLRKIKEPLMKMDAMIGMRQLKQSVLDQILFYLQNLHNLNSDQDFMHTVIYGSPGTGKTEIAKLIGDVFTHLGILTKGTFTKVTRSDLIAGYLGQTAIKTKDVIKESLGGVLFIDEAYSLGNSEKRDSFSKECIDTICEAASDYKDNLMIIIAGYEKELNECFFNYNPGLNSRFNWRFKTDVYTSEDLYNIFLKKVSDAGWSVSTETTINTEWFENNKDYFQFYGRDMETLLSKIKIAHARRIFGKPETQRKKITLEDMNKGFYIFMENEEVKKRKEHTSIQRSLSSMYI